LCSGLMGSDLRFGGFRVCGRLNRAEACVKKAAKVQSCAGSLRRGHRMQWGKSSFRSQCCRVCSCSVCWWIWGGGNTLAQSWMFCVGDAGLGGPTGPGAPVSPNYCEFGTSGDVIVLRRNAVDIARQGEHCHHTQVDSQSALKDQSRFPAPRRKSC
jgi:hypothetical protein